MYLHTIEKGHGPVLVLLHGNFGDALDWAPVLDPLAEHFHVITVESPGCGLSDKPDAAYDASFFTNALEEFFQARELHHCAVMGHSLGGQIALAFGLARPHRIGRLVLVDTGGFQQYPKSQLVLLQQRFTEPVVRALTPEQARLVFSALFLNSTPATEEYVEKQVRKPLRDDWAEVARMASRSFQFHVAFCVLPQLAQIVWPTLLVWGENDTVAPVAQAQTALPFLPDASLRVIPFCGHAPQIERPAEFLECVLRFLPRS